MIKKWKSISFVVLILGMVLIVSGCRQQENVIEEESVSEDIVTSEVEYFDGANGYLAKPVEEGDYPALILIHEWWGLNDNIRSLAEDFAEEGYVALAVDLYDGEVTEDPEVARVLATAVRGDMDGAFENLSGAIEYLKSLDEVKADSLASVGWCFGAMIGQAFLLQTSSGPIISIPKNKIKAVDSKKSFLSKKIIVTLDDDSKHTFNYGMLSIDKVLDAVRIGTKL